MNGSKINVGRSIESCLPPYLFYFNLNISHTFNTIIFSSSTTNIFLRIFLYGNYTRFFSLIGKLVASVKLQGKQWAIELE